MPTTTSSTLHTLTGTLTPHPPFDFAKTLSFIQGFSPAGGEQGVADSTLTKAVTLQGRAIAFSIHSTGTIDEPELAYTLHSATPISQAEHAAITDRIRFFLSLDDDLTPFYAVGRDDLAFAPIITRCYGLHQPKFLTPFEIACWAILTQRTPMPLAHRVKLALVTRFGTSITLPSGIYQAFPEPAQLLAADPAELAALIHNERKVDYLRAVIAYFADADEHWLRAGDYAEVATQLCGIRGVGEWSAHFILVRGLGRMEHVSVADQDLAKAAASIYRSGQPLTRDELQQIYDRYGPTQGYWAFYARNGAMADV